MREKIKYSPIILGYDIETSTTEYEDTKVAYPYLHGIIKTNFKHISKLDYSEKLQYHAFRTNKDVLDFFEEINNSTNERVLCYVHNLSYEYSFLAGMIKEKYGTIYDIENGSIPSDYYMGDSPRKPFKVVFPALPNIEFRCSYKILNKSLAKVGESIGLPKLEKQDNYQSQYTPWDNLPQEEYEYNKRDIEVTLYGVMYMATQGKEWFAKNTNDLAKIYSVTSYNKLCVQSMMGNRNTWYFRNHNLKLKPQNMQEYSILDRAYVGGYTHANIYYNDVDLSDVHSIDLTSAYPSNMVGFKYPTKMIKGTYKMYSQMQKVYDKVGFIGLFKFKNIKCVNDMSYISRSKCISISKDCVLDNGKVLKASELTIYVNEIQYNLIKKLYTYDECLVDDDNLLIMSKYKSLPKYYTDCIYQYAKQKTELKHTLETLKEGTEEYISTAYELMKTKNILNGLYGTHGMRYIRPELVFDGEKYTFRNPANVDEILEKAKNKYFDLVIAIYTTTYTHKVLFDAIIYLQKNNAEIVYCDTDSIKFFADNVTTEKVKNWVQEINDKMVKEIENTQGLKFNKDFGFISFDYEKCYKNFKTLGAKKYTYQLQDGYIGVTIAGVPKTFEKWVNNQYRRGRMHYTFDWFTYNTTIPHEITNKLTTNYQDDVYIDLPYYKGFTGVVLENCDYCLNNSIENKWVLEIEWYKEWSE